MPVATRDDDGRKVPNLMANRRAQTAEAKRAKYLELLNEGLLRHEARVQAGWPSREGLAYNRRKHPQWAAECDYAYAMNRKMKRADNGNPRPKDYAVKEKERRTKKASAVLTHGEFVQKYFKDRDLPLPHQTQIADVVNNLEPREIVLVLIWPGAGKTSTLEDWICRRLAEDPSHRIQVVSESQFHSKKMVQFVKRRMTEPTREWEAFIARFGPFYEKGQEKSGRVWAAEEIMVARNRGVERDFNLVAKSWTSAIYGSRIDTLILDDLQSQKNLNQAEEIFNRIRGTFFSRDSQKAELRTVIIGTRIGPGDVYERFMDAGLVTRTLVLGAAMPDTGEPRVPQWWDRGMKHNGKGACCPPALRSCPRDNSPVTPREYMELIRFQNGEASWWASYMQNPRTEERSTFAVYLDRCLDRDRRYGLKAS